MLRRSGRGFRLQHEGSSQHEQTEIRDIFDSTFEKIAIRNDFVEAALPHRVLRLSNVESAGVRVGHPDRQRELERCPFRVRTQGREAATVRLDDRPTDRETHSHALDLGREE